MAKKRSFLMQAVCLGLGLTAAAAGAAAVAAAVGFRRWARDEYAHELELGFGKGCTLLIRKGEREGSFLVDLRRTQSACCDAEPEETGSTAPVVEITLPPDPEDAETTADGCQAGGGDEA